MKLIIILALAFSSFAYADVEVTYSHDAEFYHTQVTQTTSIKETNDLHDFFEALNTHEEYRETEVVKIFRSQDKSFSFFCSVPSHPRDEMVASCTFLLKKSLSSQGTVMGMKGFEIWTFNQEAAKEILPILPTKGRPVVINVNRKFSVAAFPDLVAFNFNL